MRLDFNGISVFPSSHYSNIQMLTCKGGIASFQAIMHILSELRNPLFDVPERQRALRAIQMSRLLRENNTAKAWQAVKNMIDKAIAEHNLSPQSSSHTSAHLDPSTSKSVFAELRTAASYTYPRSVASYDEPPVSAPPPPPPQLPLQLPQHTMQPQPDPMQDLQSMQNQMPCWDDFNLSNINNIVGDVLPNADMVPDFDFVGGNATKHMRMSQLINLGFLG